MHTLFEIKLKPVFHAVQTCHFFFLPLQSFTLTACELKNTVDVERT